ncbi:hypothetical protein GGS26DRAFT_97109 [Hypomontagnella submonticulosa]|nr:hypothetical protein GGS26DRAFT_97109 [Hypomontagnella submonticulosa]
MPGDKLKHPTPAEAFELAAKHAALLRGLFLHPRFKYAQKPTADFVQPDTEQTPPALLFVSDFVQRTYIEYVIPFLPAGATRKCKDIANPWAWSDPNYKFEWVWNAAEARLEDADGNVKEFPKLRDSEAVEKMGDLVGRGFMVRKAVLENSTDPKAKILLGGQTFDFGEEVEKLVNETYPW